MSRLSDFGETLGWIQSWGLEASPEHAARHVTRAAGEQLTNCANLLWLNRSPTWCNPDEYRLCVAVIQQAASEFAAVAALVALCELVRADARERAAAAELAAIKARPLPRALWNYR